MLTREQLVALLKREAFDAAGAHVYVTELASGDLCEFLHRYSEAKEDARAQLAAFRFLVGCSLIGTDGKRLYPRGSEQETGVEIPAAVFDAIRDRAMTLNAIAKEESDAAGNG